MDTNGATVIVTEERKRRRGLLWVGLGAVALVSGGSTFALWSASDTFTGGDITAGDLNIAQTADTAYYDVSADRVDATETVPGTDGSQPGHLVTDTTWRAVPGDKVAAAFSADVTLEGDNLVAALSIEGLDAMTSGNASMTWTYEVYNQDTLLVAETAVPADSTLFHLSAPATGQATGVDDGIVPVETAGGAAATTVYQMTDETEDVTVVLYGTFADVDDRTDVTTVDTLADLTLNLQQVRQANDADQFVD